MLKKTILEIITKKDIIRDNIYHKDLRIKEKDNISREEDCEMLR